MTRMLTAFAVSDPDRSGLDVDIAYVQAYELRGTTSSIQQTEEDGS